MLYTSTELAKIWNISSRRISTLCCEDRVEGAFKKGKTWLIPDTAVKPNDQREKVVTNKNVKLLNIQNRRYLGNKYNLLDFIETTIEEHCPGTKSLFDVFSGTGVVAYGFMDKIQVITNDILYSNYLAHVAFLSDMKFNAHKINHEISLYNALNTTKLEDNYMSINFGNTYFSYNDCKKIGYIRQRIEDLHNSKKINKREFAILVTSLLYSMDRIANTCGHYDAYRKGVEYDKPLVIYGLDLSKQPIGKNQFYNDDSNILVKKDNFPTVDCVYCDPPYNSRNYSDLYHVLENVARWDKPIVVGVAKKMDRTALKSKYCGKEAADAFEDLVDNLNCKYIILSYNSTADKADDRSNARISDKDILRILGKKGQVKIYSKKYKAFTTGKSNNIGNEERLFVCTVQKNKNENFLDKVVKSPLNYVGGKTKLLPQILPLFPSQINTFIDLFCGGANVGVNIQAKKVVYNDNDNNLVGLLKLFSKYSSDEIIRKVEEIIEEFGLSNTEKYGYKIYECNSADGLGKFNKDKFLRLRATLNSIQYKDDNYYFCLFTLIIFGFNNQIRFNFKGKFNLPVGKRDFNKNIKENLKKFNLVFKNQNKEIICKDFRKIDLSSVKKGDFVYCDPPYLIANASYNEQGGWVEKDDIDLLTLLDNLNGKNVMFAISNVIRHKGVDNNLLISWAKKYNIHKLNYNYKNSNYHRKNDGETQEVLITNY